MPIIKSAKKRVKVAAKANTRNVRTRRTLREALKAYSVALKAGKPAQIAKTQTAAISALDIAAKKNVIHRNKAARKKSQLMAQAKNAGVKPTVAKSTKLKAKSTSTKKQTIKTAKTSPKKPAVKKPTTKAKK